MCVGNVSTVINLNNNYVWQLLQYGWPQWESKPRLWSSWHHSMLIELCMTKSLLSNCKHMSVCFFAYSFVCKQDVTVWGRNWEKKTRTALFLMVSGRINANHVTAWQDFHPQTTSILFQRTYEVRWDRWVLVSWNTQTNTDMHQWAQTHYTDPRSWVMDWP